MIGGFERFSRWKKTQGRGIDATHNPEFTSCEFYAAYTDLQEIAELLERLFRHLGQVCDFDGFPIDCLKESKLFPNWKGFVAPKLIQLIRKVSFNRPLRHLKPEQPLPPTAKIFDKLVGALIEPRCIEPTFLLGIRFFC